MWNQCCVGEGPIPAALSYYDFHYVISIPGALSYYDFHYVISSFFVRNCEKCVLLCIGHLAELAVVSVSQPEHGIADGLAEVGSVGFPLEEGGAFCLQKITPGAEMSGLWQTGGLTTGLRWFSTGSPVMVPARGRATVGDSAWAELASKCHVCVTIAGSTVVAGTTSRIHESSPSSRR